METELLSSITQKTSLIQRPNGHKCDLEKPSCGRCVKNHRVCEYRNRQDLMFCDQTRMITSRSRHRARPRNPTPPASPKQSLLGAPRARMESLNFVELSTPTTLGSLYRNPSSKIDDRASSFFFNSYVSNCWGICQPYFDYLPMLYDELPTNNAFSNIIIALGMAGLSKTHSIPELAHLSRTKYAAALRALNAAIQDPEEVKADRTLVAIMLFPLYEVGLFSDGPACFTHLFSRSQSPRRSDR